MPGRTITKIVIHCSASPNGVALTRDGRNAAQVIDHWHANRKPPFRRSPTWRLRWNQPLGAIGYHYVIDTNGFQYTGRHLDEVGAHAAGHNADSIGICCAGYDKLTIPQWTQLRGTVSWLLQLYPHATVCGHRDLSPDLNRDGRITPNEFYKICPGFNAIDWWMAGMVMFLQNTCDEVK